MRVTDAMQEGDYLLIQFGHNDQKPEPGRRTEPFEHLSNVPCKTYIDAARDSGGYSGSSLRRCSGVISTTKGTFVPSHGDYPEAVRQLAQREGVACIDLCALSEEKLVSLGPDGSKSLFRPAPSTASIRTTRTAARTIHTLTNAGRVKWRCLCVKGF